MSEMRFEQAILQQYTDTRTVQCIQIPDNFPLVNVQLPSTLSNQIKPQLGSLILVASIDNFKHYVVAVLREPSPTFNQNTDQTLNSDSQYRESLQPGEVFLQAAGTPNQGTGLDAYLYIGNNGSVEISSSSTTEQIIVGGETFDDEDHEIIIQAPNMFIESPLESAVGIQSTFTFDDNNNIQIANNTVTASTSIGVPICELTMDAVGDITLKNTAAGITNTSLSLSSTGDVTLNNTTSTLNFDILNGVALNSFSINLNKGVNPAARQNDSIFSSLIQDQTFWDFIQNLFIVFNSHSHISNSPGDPTSPPAPLLVSFPTSMNGIVSSGSSTVKIG
jgi:hypothetical protein